MWVHDADLKRSCFTDSKTPGNCELLVCVWGGVCQRWGKPPSISASFTEDEMSLIRRVTNLSWFACDFSCFKSEPRVPGEPLSPRKPGWLVSLLIQTLAPCCSGNCVHFWFVVIVAVCILGSTKAAPSLLDFCQSAVGSLWWGGGGAHGDNGQPPKSLLPCTVHSILLANLLKESDPKGF